MLLTMTDTPLRAELMRKIFVKLQIFSYLSLPETLTEDVHTYDPKLIIIHTSNFTDELTDAIAALQDEYPDMRWILMTNCEPNDIPCRLVFQITLRQNARMNTILFFYLKLMPMVPNTALVPGKVIAKGLYLNPYFRTVMIYGYKMHFSPTEIYIMRYLVEIFPRRATAEEIGKHCFAFRYNPPRSTVAAQISGINKHAGAFLHRKLITCVTKEGYTIDF